jgi:hypothetical protein
MTKGATPTRTTDADVLAERRKLELAPRACRRCVCPNPIGLVDEDGETVCFRCGWPLERGGASGVPPGNFPAAA